MILKVSPLDSGHLDLSPLYELLYVCSQTGWGTIMLSLKSSFSFQGSKPGSISHNEKYEREDYVPM